MVLNRTKVVNEKSQKTNSSFPHPIQFFFSTLYNNINFIPTATHTARISGDKALSLIANYV
jgi:hypothetical protein